MQSLAIVLLSASTAVALSGKASTTRYYDGQQGACGCGTSASSPFAWQSGGDGFYTAAGSTALFGSGTWCGSGCGSCYKLTSTGSAPNGQGGGGASGQSITVMVTNLCPYSGNEKWCPSSGANDYGFNYHFDLMAQSEILGDNPIVDFESVACPGTASSDYAQCECASSS